MKSQSDVAYENLFTLIQTGQLSPGDRIMETEIATRIALSRTPVRDAIRRLEGEGLITHSPRIGAIVTKLDHQEIVQLYEMRIVLEETAAGMATKHASTAEIDLLFDLNAQMKNAGTDQNAAQINREFHVLLFKAARNKFLLKSFEQLSTVLIVLGSTTLARAERRKDAFAEHQSIINAISEGDAQAAKQASRVHLSASLGERLRNNP